MAPLSPADRALAAAFAGTTPLDVEPLTEADRLEIDVAYARAKDSGALRRSEDDLALRLQIADQTMLRVLGAAL